MLRECQHFSCAVPFKPHLDHLQWMHFLGAEAETPRTDSIPVLPTALQRSEDTNICATVSPGQLLWVVYPGPWPLPAWPPPVQATAVQLTIFATNPRGCRSSPEHHPTLPLLPHTGQGAPQSLCVGLELYIWGPGRNTISRLISDLAICCCKDSQGDESKQARN